MNYLIYIEVGTSLITAVLLYLIFKTVKGLKRKTLNKFRALLNIIVIIFLTGCISVVVISTVYNFYYESAIKLIENSNYHEAVECLETSLAIRDRLGNSSKFFDKPYLGLPLFFSTEKDVRNILARSFKQLKDYDKAIEQYLVIISFEGEKYDTMADIAECYFVMRNFVKAADYYRKIIDLNPKEKDFEYYFRMGKAFMVLLNCEKALSFFQKALESKQQCEIVTSYIKMCDEQLNEQRKTGPDLEKGQTRDPAAD